MLYQNKQERRVLELMLIGLVVGLTCLVYKLDGYKIVTLNLFYLPVVLSGFFLGRYATGLLAVFCVMTTSLLCALQLDDFCSQATPLAMGLTVTTWGAVLCLTSLLVGTLSDERAAQAVELHEAYVGVVEVLAKYLQGGNPQLNASTNRVVRLSQAVASQMKIPSKRIDDIRVAALMQGFSRIEITTKVITRAVSSLEGKGKIDDFSFNGTDLAHSLGAVLRGAIPILINQDPSLPGVSPERSMDVPVGARILRVVRAYDSIVMGRGNENLSSAEAIMELRADGTAAYDSDVLEALEAVVAERHESLQLSR
jgi:hypothetical protein